MCFFERDDDNLVVAFVEREDDRFFPFEILFGDCSVWLELAVCSERNELTAVEDIVAFVSQLIKD